MVQSYTVQWKSAGLVSLTRMTGAFLPEAGAVACLPVLRQQPSLKDNARNAFPAASELGRDLPWTSGPLEINRRSQPAQAERPFLFRSRRLYGRCHPQDA